MSEPNRFVVVLWIDHYTDHGWNEARECREFDRRLCKTAGWVIDESDAGIIVCGSLSGSQTNNRTYIVREGIRRVFEIPEPIYGDLE